MGSDKSKKIAKNTLFLYLRMLFSLGITLYTSRVILQVLGVTDFGIFNVVGGVVNMFVFLNSSLAAVTQRFLTFEIGKENWTKLIRVFNVSVSIHLFIAIIIFILGETVGLWFVCNKLVIPIDRLDAALWVYHFVILASMLSIMNVPYVGVVIARERMDIFAFVSIAETVLKLAIVYFLVLFHVDKLLLYGFLIGVSSLVVFLTYRIICYHKFQETHIKRLIWDRHLFYEMAIFAGWAMNGNLAVLGYTQGLNILLNLFFGPATNAARAIAVQIQNAINGFSSNFQTALNPQITKSYASGDLSYMHKLIFASSKLSFFLLLVISLPIYFEVSYILNLWLGEVPGDTLNFIRFTIAIGLISTLSNPLIVAIQATGKIRTFQLWEGTTLLMIVPVAYVFLTFGYPADSVFMVHLSIALIAQVIRIVIIGKAIRMNRIDYFQKIVIRILIILPLSLGGCYWIHQNFGESFWRVVLVGLCGILTVLVSLYLIGLEINEKKILHEYVCKILSRNR